MLTNDHWTEDRLGQVLVSSAIMTVEDWDRALSEIREARLQVGPALQALGWVNEKDLVSAVCTAFRVPYLPEAMCRPDPAALAVLPQDTLRQTGVLPIGRFGAVLTIAVPGFVRSQHLEEIRRASGCSPLPFVALPSVVRARLKEMLETGIKPGVEPDPQEDGESAAPTDAVPIPSLPLEPVEAPPEAAEVGFPSLAPEAEVPVPVPVRTPPETPGLLS